MEYPGFDIFLKAVLRLMHNSFRIILYICKACHEAFFSVNTLSTYSNFIFHIAFIGITIKYLI